MSADDVFFASRDRCMADSQFIPAFYGQLFHIAPELESYFSRVDMGRQENMLRTALYELADLDNFTIEKMNFWLDLSTKHHEYDIQQEHFDSWMSCMLKCVSEHDPQYNKEIEKAWNGKLEQIIALMTLMY